MNLNHSVFQSNPDAAGGGVSVPEQLPLLPEQTQPLDTGLKPGEADAGSPPAKQGGGQGVASELSPEMKARIDFEKRTAQLAYEAREAKRRARDAEERAAQAETARREIESRLQGSPKKPEIEQFNSMVEYIDAATKWEAQQQIGEVLKRIGPQQPTQEQVQFAQMREAEAFHRQVMDATVTVTKVAMEKYPDLKDLPPTDLPNFWQTNPVAAQAILQSETSADVLNYLVRNPDRAWRLAQGDPAMTLREIGRIEALVTTSGAPKNSPGEAPPPGERLRGGGGGNIPRNLDEMSMEEYTRKREADIRKAKGK